MESQDQAAITAVLAGDKEAYRALVMRYSARLFRVAFRITESEADAEDVVQEAFLRGYRKLQTFEARSDFGTWIYRIAVRCALNKLRATRSEDFDRIGEDTDPEKGEMQLPDAAAGPERMLLSGEISALQQQALRSLTATERTAFVLRHLEDCSSDEIAEVLGMTPNAVKQAVFRAVQKLRRRLAVLRIRT